MERHFVDAWSDSLWEWCPSLEEDIRISGNKLQVSLPAVLTVWGTVTLGDLLVSPCLLGRPRSWGILLPQPTTYWDGKVWSSLSSPEAAWLHRCLGFFVLRNLPLLLWNDFSIPEDIFYSPLLFLIIIYLLSLSVIQSAWYVCLRVYECVQVCVHLCLLHLYLCLCMCMWVCAYMQKRLIPWH